MDMFPFDALMLVLLCCGAIALWLFSGEFYAFRVVVF